MQFYSDPERENDPHALPDVEVFELTALETITETGQWEDEVGEYMRHHEFRLANMNSRVREMMLEQMVFDLNIRGGWFYQYCSPGCMPESAPNGPYFTAAEAKEACRDECAA